MDMLESLLSIIVPVYNTEDEYLSACLNSLDQDVSNYVVILVDDGSENHTSNFCRKWVESHYAKFIYVRQENSGQNSARSHGADLTRSKYVTFVDSDDTLAPGSLSLLIARLMEEAPDILLFGFRPTVLGEQLADVSETSNFYRPEKRTLLANHSSIWGLAIETSLFRRQPLALGFNMGEDLASVLPIIAAAKTISETDAIVYGYTQRGSSVVHSEASENSMVILRAFERFESLGIADVWHDEVEWQAIKHLLFWEPIRLISAGVATKERKQILFGYMSEQFPCWRNNPYLKSEGTRLGLAFRILTNGHWSMYAFLKKAKKMMGKA